MKKLECIECGSVATEQHHVIPKSMGGTSTVPLCGTCHARVHSISGTRRDDMKYLTWAGRVRANEEYAVKFASFLIWYTWSGETTQYKKHWPKLIANYTCYEGALSANSINSMLEWIEYLWNEQDESLFDPLIDGLDHNYAGIVRDTIPQFLGT